MSTIDDLRERTRGQIFTEGDEGYDEARRVHNAMHDKRPQVVVRCENAGDVMAAVDYRADEPAGPGGPRRIAQRARVRHRSTMALSPT